MIVYEIDVESSGMCYPVKEHGTSLKGKVDSALERTPTVKVAGEISKMARLQKLFIGWDRTPSKEMVDQIKVEKSKRKKKRRKLVVNEDFNAAPASETKKETYQSTPNTILVNEKPEKKGICQESTRYLISADQQASRESVCSEPRTSHWKDFGSKWLSLFMTTFSPDINKDVNKENLVIAKSQSTDIDLPCDTIPSLSSLSVLFDEPIINSSRILKLPKMAGNQTILDMNESQDVVTAETASTSGLTEGISMYGYVSVKGTPHSVQMK
jgi:hypothetical protein